MSTHRIYLERIPDGDQALVVGGEAHHALRVKRLVTGDAAELIDGRGTIAAARIRETHKRGQSWEVALDIVSRVTAPRPTPALHVLASAPKGDRLHDMIAGLSQVGAASWSPLLSARTIAEPREAKMERLSHVAVESLKQCGRPWLLEILPAMALADAASRPRVIVADGSGTPYRHAAGLDHTLLIGPEGGWTSDELAVLRAAGATIASFGAHTMRTETAAVVAAGIVLHASLAG